MHRKQTARICDQHARWRDGGPDLRPRGSPVEEADHVYPLSPLERGVGGRTYTQEERTLKQPTTCTRYRLPKQRKKEKPRPTSHVFPREARATRVQHLVAPLRAYALTQRMSRKVTYAVFVGVAYAACRVGRPAKTGFPKQSLHNLRSA